MKNCAILGPLGLIDLVTVMFSGPEILNVMEQNIKVAHEVCHVGHILRSWHCNYYL